LQHKIKITVMETADDLLSVQQCFAKLNSYAFQTYGKIQTQI